MTVNDNTYQWLERRSRRRKQWLQEEQARFTDFMSAHQDLRNRILKDVTAVTDLERTHIPSQIDTYIYFWRYRPGQEQPKLYRVKEGTDKEELVLDPETIDPPHKVVVEEWSPNEDNTILAFSINFNGGESSYLMFKDLTTGEMLPDALIDPTASFTWGKGKDFYYKQFKGDRYDRPTVWKHVIGTHFLSDKKVFDMPLDDEQFLSMSSTDNLRYVVLSISRSFNFDDIYLLDTSNDKVYTIATDEQARMSVEVVGSHVVVKTDLNAPKYRILRCPLSENMPAMKEWEEIVPEEDLTLESWYRTKNFFVLHYLKDGATKAVVTNHDGNRLYDIPLPPLSYVSQMTSASMYDHVYIEHETFTKPSAITRFDLQDKTSLPLFKETMPDISSAYESTYTWYISSDGTKVPIYLVLPRNRKGPVPIFMHGYGGFSHITTPHYIGYSNSLIAAGFGFVYPCIRGGGELGASWHEAGTKRNKQRSFDDFMAAAEYLIDNGITTADKLAINGASNGGLLVAACMLQRPELFGAVICEVPLIDMMRFHLDDIQSWVHEYGDPDVPEDRATILKWNPLTNIEAGRAYPPILVTTGDNDSRVSPQHAYKFVAKLKDMAGDTDNLILLRNESAAGHSGGVGLQAWREERADALTFVLSSIALD